MAFHLGFISFPIISYCWPFPTNFLRYWETPTSSYREWSNGSLYVSAKLRTYPSPKPTFCPKWEASVNVGLGEGTQLGSHCSDTCLSLFQCYFVMVFRWIWHWIKWTFSVRICIFKSRTDNPHAKDRFRPRESHLLAWGQYYKSDR